MAQRTSTPTPGSRSHRRTFTKIQVGFEESTLPLLRERARAAGLSLAAYVRRSVLAQGEPVPAAPVAAAAALGRLAAVGSALAELASELARRGGHGESLELVRAIRTEVAGVRSLLLGCGAAPDQEPPGGEAR